MGKIAGWDFSCEIKSCESAKTVHTRQVKKTCACFRVSQSAKTVPNANQNQAMQWHQGDIRKCNCIGPFFYFLPQLPQSKYHTSSRKIPTNFTFSPTPQHHICLSETFRSPAPAPLIQARPHHCTSASVPPSS
jgi:hypothetical protein